ncbi:MAG: GAF domain-containing protein [Firmicutes bacterium]|nr:GAF domain-containing protein [Bacillota bacterium]
MDATDHLIEALNRKKLINRKKLQEARDAQKKLGLPLEKLLVDAGAVSKEVLLQVKSELYNVNSVDLMQVEVDREAAQLIPISMSQRYNLLCFGGGQGKILIAMDDPSDVFAKEYVKMRTGLDVLPMVCFVGDLIPLWKDVYAVKPMKPKAEKKEGEPKPPPRMAELGSGIRKPDAVPKLKLREEIVYQRPKRVVNLPGFAVPETVVKTAEAPSPSSIITAASADKEDMEILFTLSKSAAFLNAALSEDELITKILETALKICKATGSSLLMKDKEENLLFFKVVIGEKGKELEKKRIPLDENSIAGWVFLHGEPSVVNDVSKEPRHYKAVDQSIGFHTLSILAAPIFWGRQVLGVIEVVNKTDGNFTEKDKEYLTILSSQAAVAIYNSNMMEQLHNFYIEIVEILIDFLEALDSDSKTHVLDVSRLSVAMGRKLKLQKKEMENLCYAAFLHDIGKIKCPRDEYTQHPELGAEMLQHISIFKDLVPYVKYHHENYDGSGYPEGVKGESIPLGARILAIAEAYEEGRVGVSEEEQAYHLDEFLKDFGTKFDPALKEAFLSIFEVENA